MLESFSMPSFFIICAGICWGMIALFVNFIKSLGFDSIQIVAIRCFFASLLMIIFCLIKNPSTLKIKFCHLPYFLGTGILSIAFFNFCYFQALSLIGGSSIPALLLYTSPIFVTIISIFLFKEKINLQKIVALFLTLLGLVFVTGVLGKQENLSFIAFLFGIGSGFCYALYSIFGKLIGDRYSSLTITAYTFIISALFTIPISNVFFDIRKLFCVNGILCALGLALFSTVLPFILYTYGLKKIETGKAAILATVEPLVATIIGVLFLDEILSISKIIGIVLIISSVLVLNVKFKNNN